MRSILKSAFIALVLTGFVSLSAVGFFFHFMKIESVDLKIDPQFNPSHWTAETKQKITSRINGYKGKKIWRVDLEDMAHELKKLYPAGRFRIRRRLPNRIVVFLKESKPLLLLLKGKEAFYPVSAQGDLHPPLAPGRYRDLPVLRGEVFYKNSDLRKQAVSLILSLPNKELLTLKNISEITYDGKKKVFTLFLIPGHFSLEISGPPEEKRIQNINFVLNYLLQRKMTGRTIDARFEKKIIVNTPDSS